MMDLLELADLVEAADVGELTDHDDELELPGGYRLKLVVESDPDSQIEDSGDWFGRLEWAKDGDYGSRRPDGMDGRAKILERDRWSGSFWWQPPTDIGPEHLDGLESSIRQIMRDGYYWVALELRPPACESCRCAEPPTISQWGIGGVDDIGAEYIRELTRDLVGEVAHDARQQAGKTVAA